MEKHTITRDGDKPIVFTGERIGEGSTHSNQGSNEFRYTDVYIYRTKGGKYVVDVQHITRWQGEQSTSTAAALDTPDDVIAWLKEDNDGNLGRASQEACEEAAKNDEAFGKAFVEEVE